MRVRTILPAFAAIVPAVVYVWLSRATSGTTGLPVPTRILFGVEGGPSATPVIGAAILLGPGALVLASRVGGIRYVAAVAIILVATVCVAIV